MLNESGLISVHDDSATLWLCGEENAFKSSQQYGLPSKLGVGGECLSRVVDRFGLRRIGVIGTALDLDTILGEVSDVVSLISRVLWLVK